MNQQYIGFDEQTGMNVAIATALRSLLRASPEAADHFREGCEATRIDMRQKNAPALTQNTFNAFVSSITPPAPLAR